MAKKMFRVKTASGIWVHAAQRYGTTERPRYAVLCNRVPRRHSFIEVPRSPVDCPHCLSKIEIDA